MPRLPSSSPGRLVGLLSCLLAVSCSDAFAKDDGRAFGDDLGRFRVGAKLKSSSCGSEALDTPESWQFDVVMSHDGDLIYWNTNDSAVEGKLASDEKAFSFSSETSVNVDANAKVPRCTIVRGDDASGSFDAAADRARSFTGSLEYRFSPGDGSDCSDLVASAGFEDLPCSMTYRMAATWVAKR
jgi:hypothetical protein